MLNSGMEATGHLVVPAVFKTDVADSVGQAGSIPVRLRDGDAWCSRKGSRWWAYSLRTYMHMVSSAPWRRPSEGTTCCVALLPILLQPGYAPA